MPNPQPGGPSCLSLSGLYLLTFPAWVTLRHSSPGHGASQAPPPRQGGDTFGGDDPEAGLRNCGGLMSPESQGSGIEKGAASTATVSEFHITKWIRTRGTVSGLFQLTRGPI
jgi:hypothetical protein